ncbi:hypothetical protein Dimus_018935 [Dionaea muscipula]
MGGQKQFGWVGFEFDSSSEFVCLYEIVAFWMPEILAFWMPKILAFWMLGCLFGHIVVEIRCLCAYMYEFCILDAWVCVYMNLLKIRAGVEGECYTFCFHIHFYIIFMLICI